MQFNGIDFKQYCKIEDVRRNLHPSNAVIIKKIPGKIGTRLMKREIDQGYIEVDIRVIEKNKATVQEKSREIAGLLSTDDLKEISFHDESNKFYKAILSGDTKLDRFLFTGFATLIFLCPDPLAYSKTKTTIKDIHNKTLINQGTYKTIGTITIKISSNINNLKVALQNTGEFIYLGDDFKTNDVIEINLRDEYVKKNGNLIMDKLYFESDFFDIPVGEFTITTTNGTMDIEFRERWL